MYSWSGSHRESTGHWNFDQAGINSATTHVPGFWVLKWRGFRLKMSGSSKLWTLVKYARANFWLQRFIVISVEEIELLKKLQSSWFSIFLHGGKSAPPYTSLDLAQNLLSDRLWAPLLYGFIRIDVYLGRNLDSKSMLCKCNNDGSLVIDNKKSFKCTTTWHFKSNPVRWKLFGWKETIVCASIVDWMDDKV